MEVDASPSMDLDLEAVAQTWKSVVFNLNPTDPGVRGFIRTAEAWSLAEAYLYPRDIAGDARHPPKDAFGRDDVRKAFSMLQASKQLGLFLNAYLDTIRQRQHLITQDIQRHMQLYEAGETPDPEIIQRLAKRLVTWYKAWQPDPELNVPPGLFTSTFHTHVFSVLPPSFLHGFKVLLNSTMEPPHNALIWSDFELLGLIERYDSLIAAVVNEKIEEYVQATCARDWSESKLPMLRSWVAEKVGQWMIYAYARGAKTSEEARQMLLSVKSRFDFHLCKTLCDLRTSEIFDIIVDFPDSTPALNDLKECLLRVDQRAQFVSHLRKENRRRLLHPGANTDTILYQYVSTIKCLRLLDHAGVLLFKVADPIRKYLRERPDTIRSIVANLVGEGSDLVDENEPPQPLQLLVDDYSDPHWDPEPIDAGPEFRSAKPTDVLSTLVSIYDSQDLFVKELQVLLAQRLLAAKDGNIDKERRNVEILKIRFGEEALQVCEVMLKDMSDSRRVDQHVQAQGSSVLHPTIISKHFWPPLQSSELAMPGQFKTLQEQYALEYSQFKPDKRLRWIPHLGTVDIELELSDRTLDVSVSPLEAAIIELFSNCSVWTTPGLAQEVGVADELAIGKAVMTWIDYGVLKETGDQEFTLLEEAESDHALRAKPNILQAPADSGIQSVQVQEAEQMRVYWKFVQGMLTNLNALPTDRVHNMLKLAPGFDRTVEQVAVFMEALRREGLVMLVDGAWRLNKS